MKALTNFFESFKTKKQLLREYENQLLFRYSIDEKKKNELSEMIPELEFNLYSKFADTYKHQDEKKKMLS